MTRECGGVWTSPVLHHSSTPLLHFFEVKHELMARVGLISLGCPKNVVDAEEILGQVEKAGHEIEVDPAGAEVLIVNTCGFIQSAKEESIEAILHAIRYKTDGACRSVIVTGCLAQRYGGELAREIAEADGFVGLGKAERIPMLINQTLGGERAVEIGEPSAWWTQSRSRILSTAPWTAYLRVADGCDNRCTYCAIPDIRGGFRSRPEQHILDEAGALADAGVKELNLIGQDVTRYGLDTEGNLSLAPLLDKLAAIRGIRWIRLLYCYPTRITEDLTRALAGNDKVCKYLDVPLQHSSDRVLRAMGRQGSRQEYLDLLGRTRAACPEVALRTTFIVGFPGETEADFEDLLDFVSRARFDRVGVFRYSAEEGTPAASMADQVSRRTADRRHRALMALQQEISRQKNESLVGRAMDILVERVEGDTAVGRSHRDAPDIDGLVYVTGARCQPGAFVRAEITGAGEYDLSARVVSPE